MTFANDLNQNGSIVQTAFKVNAMRFRRFICYLDCPPVSLTKNLQEYGEDKHQLKTQYFDH